MRLKETYRLNFLRVGILVGIVWAWVVIGVIGWDVYEWAHKVFAS